MICAHCYEPASTHSCGQPPLLDGVWALQAPIGEGSTGTTWRANHAEGGLTVAIKEIPLRRARSPKARELVEREARVLRELDHPGIPRCVCTLETGSGRDRTLWIVQGFVEGRTLAQEHLERRFTPDEVVAVLSGLLEILGYLHGLSPPVIHRDLKPANVMRSPSGKLRIVDFGAVRDALRDADGGGSTVAGTFGYMAPEQLIGDARPATDLFGLGALAVALLTRRAPHTLQDWSQRMQWRPHAQVPPRLADLIDRLLEPDVQRRLQTVAQAQALLARVHEPLAPTTPEQVGWRRAAASDFTAHAITAATAITAVGILVAALAWALDGALATAPAVPEARAARASTTDLSELLVENVVHALQQSDGIQDCFEALGSASVTGADLELRVDETGQASLAEILDPTPLEACLAAQVARLRDPAFPARRGYPVRVERR